jgi:tyrosine-protein phosphatase SIW14
MNSKIFFILFIPQILSLQMVQSYAQTVTERPGKWAIKVETCNLENLYKLNDSIYRSEQPNKEEFICLAETGFRSVLNLRSFHTDSKKTKGLSIKPYRVKMVARKFSDKEIVESLRILKEGPKPILVHCKHGCDRTGVVMGMYRIIFENWSKEEALDELQNGGYGFHKKYTNIIDYIKNVDAEVIKREVLN